MTKTTSGSFPTFSVPPRANTKHTVPPGLIYFFGALGTLMWGYDNGVLSGALLFIAPEFHLTPTDIGLVGSFLSIGTAVGAVVSGFLTNAIGRKPLIFGASIVFIVGVGLAVSATDVQILIASRVVTGLGIGVVALAVPVYLAEISPAGIRGRVGSLTQLMIAIGILLGYIGNFAFSPTGSWRLMFAVMIVPALALAVGVWILPESPRWLLRRGRSDEARTTLEKHLSPEEADRTMREMAAAFAAPRIQIRRVFRTRLGKVIILAIALETLTQLVGINTIVYYAPTILKSMGFSNDAALVNTIGFGAVSVAAVALASRYIDRWGRRPLLTTGALIMAAAMAIMATLSWTVGLTVGITGFVAIGALVLFKAAYSFTWSPTVRVVVSELLPTSVRGSMQGVAQVFNYAATFVLALIFPILLATGGGLVFAVFSAMGVVAFVVVFLCVPETKGQTLEEIEATVTASNPSA